MKTGIFNKKPVLSIIVIFHDMVREAERTLYSLSTPYQETVSEADYEVIAIDNGSAQPLSKSGVAGFGDNFKYQCLQTKSVSPARAINIGARAARGEFIAIIVDGARMVTPGLIRDSLRALKSFGDPFVCTLGWHLGPDVQNESMLKGYDQMEEDRLLKSINWRANGYDLFGISTIAQSSDMGLLGGMPYECSWFAMKRENFLEMDGYNERFQSPGGGLVNHDFLNRVVVQERVQPVILLGEGSFHQIHGGVATNVPIKDHPMQKFSGEYKHILGKAYQADPPANAPYYFGQIRPEAKRFVSKKL